MRFCRTSCRKIGAIKCRRAAGRAVGYAGGGLLLLINLMVYQFRESIGLDGARPASVWHRRVWWLVFGYISISRLRERGAERAMPPGDNYLSVGFKQLRQTLREIRKYPMTLRYLIAYLLYNDGVQTVIVVAAIFGAQELGMETGDLTMVILAVQIMAFFGALGFGQVAVRLGAKKTIIITLLIWSATSIWAQLSLQSVGEFWALAVVVALVLGGSQALSRSLFSQMIPHEREAKFFSFYGIE